jgi:hypothetical protein
LGFEIFFSRAIQGIKNGKRSVPRISMSMKLPLIWVILIRTGRPPWAFDSHISTWLSYLPRGKHTQRCVAKR